MSPQWRPRGVVVSSDASRGRVASIWKPRTSQSRTPSGSGSGRNLDAQAVSRGGTSHEKKAERLGRAVARRLHFNDSKQTALAT